MHTNYNSFRKAAKTLSSFIKPNQIAGPDQIIPPRILKNAKGLAIITVLKAGFLFSGRAGSGVIVARLPDGSWSPPSAIVTAGAGAGGMIGAELTDFVFVLNTAAVDTFAQLGSVTLGTNVSVAAGPLGRSAEAAGTASLGSVSAVFAYSKTKGLYAGISLEGSVLMERREANRKFYGNNCKATRECSTIEWIMTKKIFTMTTITMIFLMSFPIQLLNIRIVVAEVQVVEEYEAVVEEEGEEIQMTIQMTIITQKMMITMVAVEVVEEDHEEIEGTMTMTTEEIGDMMTMMVVEENGDHEQIPDLV